MDSVSPDQMHPESPYPDLIAGRKSHGVADVNDGQVGPAVQQLFPAGARGVDLGEAVRQVFVPLKRQRV